MSVFYMDTSAITKRYTVEIGTLWVQTLADPVMKHTLVVSELTIVEFVSVLARRQREGNLMASDTIRFEAKYLFDYKNEYFPVPVDSDVLISARQLLHRHTLRALDAMHLASALKAARLLGVSLTFVASDKHLLAAAAEGLPIDNPLNHP